MPVRRSRRDMQAFKIVVLMTTAALERDDAVAFRATADVHGVPVTIVALPRKVSARVAVHAARMLQHRENGLKCRHGRNIIALFRSDGISPNHQIEGENYQHAQEDQRIFARHHLPSLLLLATAALTRSAVKGTSRKRMPVASKMALPIAAGTTVIAVSPAPRAGTSRRSTSTTSTVGT